MTVSDSGIGHVPPIILDDTTLSWGTSLCNVQSISIYGVEIDIDTNDDAYMLRSKGAQLPHTDLFQAARS